ncbi:putative SET and MYND domain-containing protein [Paratrimastix pyriformis]|uniref:SET and MYND domain-containing protein n=1 Tax=Paratrimastix pyriformis TaxID=342808 RepID=A0ABQ8UGG0_9EUKA|nr:putative SET and MYND domain-containing protein [Paratrimastix pyriformis]
MASQHKDAGNLAFSHGENHLAIAHYTMGLAEASDADFPDPVIIAMLLSNRSAALQRVSQWAMASSDACAAVACAPSYLKPCLRAAQAAEKLGAKMEALELYSVAERLASDRLDASLPRPPTAPTPADRSEIAQALKRLSPAAPSPSPSSTSPRPFPTLFSPNLEQLEASPVYCRPLREAAAWWGAGRAEWHPRLRVAIAPEKGRHLIMEERVAPGTVILEEAPLASVPTGSPFHCAHCLRPFPALPTPPGAHHVLRYCLPALPVSSAPQNRAPKSRFCSFACWLAVQLTTIASASPPGGIAGAGAERSGAVSVGQQCDTVPVATSTVDADDHTDVQAAALARALCGRMRLEACLRSPTRLRAIKWLGREADIDGLPAHPVESSFATAYRLMPHLELLPAEVQQRHCDIALALASDLLAAGGPALPESLPALLDLPVATSPSLLDLITRFLAQFRVNGIAPTTLEPTTLAEGAIDRRGSSAGVVETVDVELEKAGLARAVEQDGRAGPETEVFVQSRLGFGLYPLMAHTNHSCDPNTMLFWKGSRLVLKAIREIGPHEEVTVSYGPCLGHYTTACRQEMLRAQYGFDCHCSACTSQASLLADCLTAGFRCPNHDASLDALWPAALSLLAAPPAPATGATAPTSTSLWGPQFLGVGLVLPRDHPILGPAGWCPLCQRKVASDEMMVQWGRTRREAAEIWSGFERGPAGFSSARFAQLRRCLALRQEVLHPGHPDLGKTLDEAARWAWSVLSRGNIDMLIGSGCPHRLARNQPNPGHMGRSRFDVAFPHLAVSAAMAGLRFGTASHELAQELVKVVQTAGDLDTLLQNMEKVNTETPLVESTSPSAEKAGDKPSAPQTSSPPSEPTETNSTASVSPPPSQPAHTTGEGPSVPLASMQSVANSQYFLDVIKEGIPLPPIDLSGAVEHLIGRGNGQIVLEHVSVSRNHCRLVHHADGALYLQDLRSTHGSFVNHKPAAPLEWVRLRVGDQLRFGGSTRLYVVGTSNSALREQAQAEAEAEAAAGLSAAEAIRQQKERLAAAAKPAAPRARAALPAGVKGPTRPLPPVLRAAPQTPEQRAIEWATRRAHLIAMGANPADLTGPEDDEEDEEATAHKEVTAGASAKGPGAGGVGVDTLAARLGGLDRHSAEDGAAGKQARKENRRDRKKAKKPARREGAELTPEDLDRAASEEEPSEVDEIDRKAEEEMEADEEESAALRRRRAFADQATVTSQVDEDDEYLNRAAASRRKRRTAEGGPRQGAPLLQNHKTTVAELEALRKERAGVHQKMESYLKAQGRCLSAGWLCCQKMEKAQGLKGAPVCVVRRWRATSRPKVGACLWLAVLSEDGELPQGPRELSRPKVGVKGAPVCAVCVVKEMESDLEAQEAQKAAADSDALESFMSGVVTEIEADQTKLLRSPNLLIPPNPPQADQTKLLRSRLATLDAEIERVARLEARLRPALAPLVKSQPPPPPPQPSVPSPAAPAPAAPAPAPAPAADAMLQLARARALASRRALLAQPVARIVTAIPVGSPASSGVEEEDTPTPSPAPSKSAMETAASAAALLFPESPREVKATTAAGSSEEDELAAFSADIASSIKKAAGPTAAPAAPAPPPTVQPAAKPAVPRVGPMLPPGYKPQPAPALPLPPLAWRRSAGGAALDELDQENEEAALRRRLRPTAARPRPAPAEPEAEEAAEPASASDEEPADTAPQPAAPQGPEEGHDDHPVMATVVALTPEELDSLGITDDMSAQSQAKLARALLRPTGPAKPGRGAGGKRAKGQPQPGQPGQAVAAGGDKIQQALLRFGDKEDMKDQKKKERKGPKQGLGAEGQLASERSAAEKKEMEERVTEEQEDGPDLIATKTPSFLKNRDDLMRRLKEKEDFARKRAVGGRLYATESEPKVLPAVRHRRRDQAAQQDDEADAWVAPLEGAIDTNANEQKKNRFGY